VEIRVKDRDGSISTSQPPIGTAMNWAMIQDAIAVALPAEWSESAKQDALEQVRTTLLGEGCVLIEKRSRRDAIAAKDPVLLALSATIEATQHAAETRTTTTRRRARRRGCSTTWSRRVCRCGKTRPTWPASGTAGTS
jgi:hypothetical protein